MKLLKIGRGQDNDIVIEDIAVSRYHAEIFQDDDGNVFLTDLQSSNGTFINGNQLAGSEVLSFNDIVKVGNTVLPWRNYLKGIAATTQDLNTSKGKSKKKKEKKVAAPKEEESLTDSSSIAPKTRRNLIFLALAFVGIAFIEAIGLQSQKDADGFEFFIGFMIYVFIGAVGTLLLTLLLRIAKVKSPFWVVIIAGLALLYAVYKGYSGAV